MYLRVQLAQIFALTGAYFMPDCHIVRYLFDTYESCCYKCGLKYAMKYTIAYF